MSFPILRPRHSGPTFTGALSRILSGAMGVGAPVPNGVDPRSVPGLYQFHEGDLFEPGAENYVFEPQNELPVKGIWGAGSGVNQGTFYPAGAWPVFQPPQVWVDLALPTAGLGGLQAGSFALQPLIDDPYGVE